MTTPVFARDGDGLGVFVMDRNGAHMFGHDGDDTGFQANAIASMDGGYGVIVMANSNNSGEIFDEIANAVFAEYGWPGRGAVLQRGAVPAEIAGVYGTAMRATIVELDHGRIYEHHPFGDRYEIVAADAKLIDLRDGKPFEASRIGDHVSPLVELVRAGLDAAIAAAHALPAADFSVDELNFFAYGVLDDNPTGAVAMFELEVAVAPDSMNAHESLAEGYEAAGDKPKAVAQYKEALATEPVDAKAPAAFKQQLHATCVAAIARLGG
jgi:hypothetical protein